eukprot:SAG11_NODE_23738_length_383_cov_297.221831_1_plen_46_part_10
MGGHSCPTPTARYVLPTRSAANGARNERKENGKGSVKRHKKGRRPG